LGEDEEFLNNRQIELFDSNEISLSQDEYPEARFKNIKNLLFFLIFKVVNLY
jgi:hypothetical protein